MDNNILSSTTQCELELMPRHILYNQVENTMDL